MGLLSPSCGANVKYLTNTAMITKEIIWKSNDYSETPAYVQIGDLNIDLIKQYMKFVEDNQVDSIRISGFDYEFYDTKECEDLEVDWRCDVAQLIIYAKSMYFYAQNKWDSGDQIESDTILITDLK